MRTKFFFVTSTDEIQHNHNIQTRLDEATTIDGTRSHHLFRPEAETKLELYSCDETHTVTDLHSKQLFIGIKQLKLGEYITAVYEERW